MRVIGYARVSTEEQGASGAGLEAQRHTIEEECVRRNWHLLRVEQDVFSGKTAKRPGLQAALDACRQGDADGLLVAKLDRLSRSMRDFTALMEKAQNEGWVLVALD